MEKHIDYLTDRSYKDAKDVIRKKELHLNDLEKKMCQQFGEELAEKIDGEILDIEGLTGYQVVVSRNPEDGSSSLELGIKVADWYVKENGEWRDSDLENRDGHYYLSLYRSDLADKITELMGERFEKVMMRKNWVPEGISRKEVVAEKEVGDQHGEDDS